MAEDLQKRERKEAPDRGRRREMSLRGKIMLLFLCVLLFVMACVGWFVIGGWRRDIRLMVKGTAEQTTKEVRHQLDKLLAVPLDLVVAHRPLLENGVVAIQDAPEREKFFSSTLLSHPSDALLSFTLGLDTGEYMGARWNAERRPELVRNNAETGGASWYYAMSPDGTAGEKVMETAVYDPRTRDWYRTADEAGALVFSPIYAHFINRDLALSVAAPVKAPDGSWHGVLGAHLTLGKVSREMADTLSALQVDAAVVERTTGALVANSEGWDNFEEGDAGGLDRRILTPSLHPSLYLAHMAYQETESDMHRTRGPEGMVTLMVTPYRLDGLDWLILTAVPESIFNEAPTARLWGAALLSVFTLALASFVFLLLADRYLRPIRSLIDTSAAFAAGDLHQRATVSHHDEIGEMAVAFSQMADRIAEQVVDLEERVERRTAAWEVANLALEEREDRLRLILDSTAEAIFGLGAQGRCTFCNASALRMLGYTSEASLHGRNMHRLIHHHHRDGEPFPQEACAVMQTIHDGKRVHRAEEVFFRSDGSRFDVSYHAHPQTKDGVVVGAVVSFMDITETRKNQERIQFLGSHDALTGLKNRPTFDEAMRLAEQDGIVPVSLLFGDVNGLKLTNDIFGHEAGDRLLRAAADILANACREEDTVARVGGDEFTILLPHTGEEGVARVQHRIMEAFAAATINGMKTTISLGAATRTQPDIPLEDLLRDAEAAMYTRKSLDRSRSHEGLLQGLMDSLCRKNPKERQHAEWVSETCERMGRAMKLPEPEVRRLREAGLFHDIGNIVLEDEVLTKPENWAGPPDETRMRHVLAGYRILNMFDRTLDLADGVLSHHEHWDGSGYPKGLREEEIPLLSRILAVADAHAVMTHGIMDPREVDAWMWQSAGILFDPALVALVLGMEAEA